MHSITIGFLMAAFLVITTRTAPIMQVNGYLVTIRPETLFDNVISDEAYNLCKDEIMTDLKTRRGGTKEPYIPNWEVLANGMVYFLPITEIRKLGVGDYCVLQKSFELLKLKEREIKHSSDIELRF